MHYESFDPNAELNGTLAQCFMKSLHLQNDFYSEIVAAHGLDHVEVDRWYCLQDLLDVLNEMNEVTTMNADFVRLGMTVAELSYQMLPPEHQGLPVRDFLANYPAQYRNRHHGDAGYVEVTEDAPNEYTLYAHTPYPDDVIYGLMWGYMRQLKAPHTTFSVSFDSTMPRHDQGADETVLHIQIIAK